MKFIILVLCSILLTIFFMYFSFAYMQYFDIGINNGIREMSIFITRTPTVIIAQISTVFFFDKFISRQKGKWRTLLNVLALVFAVCTVFIIFAMIHQGIPREGGVIRFLGYYFFGLEPGRFPGNGTW